MRGFVLAILRTPSRTSNTTCAGVAADSTSKGVSDCFASSSASSFRLEATLLSRAWHSLKSSGGLAWEGSASALSCDEKDEGNIGGEAGALSPTGDGSLGIATCSFNPVMESVLCSEHSTGGARSRLSEAVGGEEWCE